MYTYLGILLGGNKLTYISISLKGRNVYSIVHVEGKGQESYPVVCLS